jgi:hypothetical protein
MTIRIAQRRFDGKERLALKKKAEAELKEKPELRAQIHKGKLVTDCKTIKDIYKEVKELDIKTDDFESRKRKMAATLLQYLNQKAQPSLKDYLNVYAIRDMLAAMKVEVVRTPEEQKLYDTEIAYAHSRSMAAVKPTQENIEKAIQLTEALYALTNKKELKDEISQLQDQNKANTTTQKIKSITEKKILEWDAIWLLSANFSACGKFLVTASDDRTAKIWDRDGNLLHTLKGHTQPVNSANFSACNQFIVTASHDETAKIWDKEGKLLHTLEGHTGCVRSANFSPCDQFIITASEDNTAKIWDKDGKLLHTLEGHTHWVNSANFSSCGQFIVTASDDGTAKIWEIEFE